MNTLAEIKAAAIALPLEQKRSLIQFLVGSSAGNDACGKPLAETPARGHSILDIRPVILGTLLRPPSPDDDLLGEMLEGRT